MVGAIFEGIGVSSGSFLCGYLMGEVGGSITFRIFGISAICLSFVHYFVQRFLDSCTTRHGKTITIAQDKSHAYTLDDNVSQMNGTNETFKQVEFT